MNLTPVECEGLAPENAALIRQVLQQVLSQIQARDSALPPASLQRVVVAEGFAARPEATGPMLARHEQDGVTLWIDAGHVAQALAGDMNAVATLIHALHRELCRIELAQQRLSSQMLAAGLAADLAAVVEGVWLEYASTRRSAWSLPAEADLMLGHLADLLEVLPAAMAEDVATDAVQGDLQGLYVKALARIAHLLHTMAHAQGYLAGLQRGLAQAFPELDARLAGSALAPAWARLGEALEAGHCGDPAAQQRLEQEIVALFAVFGLRLSATEHGEAWLELGGSPLRH